MISPSVFFLLKVSQTPSLRGPGSLSLSLPTLPVPYSPPPSLVSGYLRVSPEL